MTALGAPAHEPAVVPGLASGNGTLRATLALAGSSRREMRDACTSTVAQQLLVAVEVSVATYVVSRAVRGASYSQLSPWILLLVLVALPQVRLPWAASAAFTAVGNRVRVEQSDRLFAAVDALDASDLAEWRTGQLTAMASDDVPQLARLFSHDLGSLVSAATMLVLAMVGVTAIDWRLGASLTVVVVGLLAVSSVLERTAAGGDEATDAEPSPVGRGRSEIIDDLQGLREIVAAGAAGRTAADLRRHATKTGRGEGATADAASIVGAGLALVPAGVLALAAVLVGGRSLSPTLVASALSLALLASRAGRHWVVTRPAIRRAVESSQRLRAVEHAAGLRAAAAPTGPDPVEPTTTDIDFSQVRVRHRRSGVDALHDVSFHVAQGETVALVGHSGAGKSTAVGLVLRFLHSDAGTVRIGGHDVAALPESTLRSLVGYVPQDTYLFHTTVRRNLQLGRPDAEDADLEAAARTARAWEFIEALPGGLDAELGERGAQLSGGQRQRLAIARALVADRPILVLDEPVSNLDVGNETALMAAMGAARQGRTTLIVAHRRSTTRQADHVVVLDQGRVTAITTGAEHHGPTHRGSPPGRIDALPPMI